jgi:2TM domain-containing protein
MIAPEQEPELRERALTQIRKKHEFHAHVAAYVLVNAMLVAIYFLTDPGGFFWPVFPILGWGIGLFFHGWDVYSAPPSEERIRKEMARLERMDG